MFLSYRHSFLEKSKPEEPTQGALQHVQLIESCLRQLVFQTWDSPADIVLTQARERGILSRLRDYDEYHAEESEESEEDEEDEEEEEEAQEQEEHEKEEEQAAESAPIADETMQVVEPEVEEVHTVHRFFIPNVTHPCLHFPATIDIYAHS